MEDDCSILIEKNIKKKKNRANPVMIYFIQKPSGGNRREQL